MPLCPAVTITFALSESLQVSTKEHSTESTSKTNKYCNIHVTSPIVSKEMYIKLFIIAHHVQPLFTHG